MEDSITFLYTNPYINTEAYQFVISNIRKYYNKSIIYTFIDSDRINLQTYLNLSEKFNVQIFTRDQECFFINRDDSIDVNIPKIKEWIDRIYYTCINTNSKWIILLEDDVFLKRKIKIFPKTHCGVNRDDVGFLGGGSIFDRKHFLECYKNFPFDFFIENVKDCSWAGDVLLKYMFLTNSSTTYEKWVEINEPDHWQEVDCAIFHGYKDLYK